MTYAQIQKYVKKKYGYTVKTCWIAHAKELCDLPLRKSHNRVGKRVYPCPDDKLDAIKEGFQYVGWI